MIVGWERRAVNGVGGNSDEYQSGTKLNGGLRRSGSLHGVATMVEYVIFPKSPEGLLFLPDRAKLDAPQAASRHIAAEVGSL
jgi:hypothetical protein